MGKSIQLILLATILFSMDVIAAIREQNAVGPEFDTKKGGTAIRERNIKQTVGSGIISNLDSAEVLDLNAE